MGMAVAVPEGSPQQPNLNRRPPIQRNVACLAKEWDFQIERRVAGDT